MGRIPTTNHRRCVVITAEPSQVVTINAPCDWINSNGRHHWATKARLTKTWRLAAYALARNQLAIGALSYCTRPVDITVYVHKTTSRRYDAHNLMPTVKACIDGLVQAGILEDDSNRYLRAVSIIAAARGEREYLELIIEPADDGGAA